MTRVYVHYGDDNVFLQEHCVRRLLSQSGNCQVAPAQLQMITATLFWLILYLGCVQADA
jgi:hypothetical protein